MLPARSYKAGGTERITKEARYYDRPEEFRPQRWLDEGAAPLRDLPFGAGLRHCTGNTYALTEAALILAPLARRFRPSRCDARAPAPFPSITLRPATPMWMTLESRIHPAEARVFA